MNRKENEQIVRNFFERGRPENTALIAKFVDDADAVMQEAAAIFDAMIPDMAYLDSPDKPMATSVFGCGVWFAVYQALRQRGVDVHDVGREMLAALAEGPAPEMADADDGRTRQERFADFIAGGEESQRNEVPGEFVFEAYVGKADDVDWGMNVTSCAICSMASKYDAMELVPYMCATDDVMSDRDNQGLRRTGSIAVGAHHCDFEYKQGGAPKGLAEQYPERIRLVQED